VRSFASLRETPQPSGRPAVRDSSSQPGTSLIGFFSEDRTEDTAASTEARPPSCASSSRPESPAATCTPPIWSARSAGGSRGRSSSAMAARRWRAPAPRYPLMALAVMWFWNVLLNLVTFIRLIFKADRYFRDERPDAVVLIDYPGLHWWIARRARARGIPVFYFVPPQLWAWAGWRVKKVRKYVDQVLCSLPFEPEWYQRRGVPDAVYVGPPYFDELAARPLDDGFLAEQRGRRGLLVAILPGSRTQEVRRNLPDMIEAARRLSRRRPDVRFAVACLH